MSWDDSSEPPGQDPDWSPRPPPNHVDIYVGSRLRLFRLLRGLSEEALAAEVGLSTGQLQKHERGACRIGAPYLVQYAQLLEVRVSDFFSGMEQTPPWSRGPEDAGSA